MIKSNHKTEFEELKERVDAHNRLILDLYPRLVRVENMVKELYSK